MSLEPRSPIEERRFTRVHDRFLVEIWALDDAEAERLAETVRTQRSYYGDRAQLTVTSSDHPDDLQVLVGHVVDRLAEMDAKIDHILGVVDRLERGDTSLGSLAGRVEALAVDISGSGVGILCPHPFEVGTRFKAVLNLPGNPPARLRVLAQVAILRTAAPPEQSLGKYHLGLGFDGINEDDRQELIRYVFQRQRVLLRSGSMEE